MERRTEPEDGNMWPLQHYEERPRQQSRWHNPDSRQTHCTRRKARSCASMLVGSVARHLSAHPCNGPREHRLLGYKGVNLACLRSRVIKTKNHDM